MPVTAGTRLADRYVLLHPIGTGGMGTVWRAADATLDRPVAVKILAAELTDDPELRQRLHREARAAARLAHPHITKVYDYGETAEDGRVVQFLVMELLSGRTLADRLHDGPLPLGETAQTGAEVGEALAAAHQNGVIHRDITPGNVMLTSTGARVLDFGISTVVGEAAITIAGRTLGTPAYLAPERVAGRPATPAVDVYALAAVLVHAVTGHTLYEGTWTDQAHAHMHAEPTLDDVPGNLAFLLTACLAKDPRSRPAAAQVATALRHIGLSQSATTALAAANVPMPRSHPPGSARATRLLPAYLSSSTTELSARKPRQPTGPGRVAAWAAVAFLAIAGGMLLLNTLTGGAGGGTAKPAETRTSSTASSTPTRTQPPEPSNAQQALEELRDVTSAALAGGDLRARAAADINRTLTVAVNLAARERFGDARKRLDDLSDRVAKRYEDGEVSAPVYGELTRLLDYLIAQIAVENRNGDGNTDGRD
jgi:serine/threonine-protein kinase